MNHKLDILGHPVFVGDEVAINPPSYKGLVKAKVVKLTPKGFTLEYMNHLGRVDTTNLCQCVKRLYAGSTLSSGSHDEMS